MRKFRSLTLALLKNNMNFVSDGKDNTVKKLAIYSVLAICFIPIISFLYFIFSSYFEVYGQLSQAGTVVAIGLFIGAFFIFFFSLFIIPGVFYFSKDHETLLSLPIKPHTILAAKFTNCLIYDYTFSFFVIAPLAIAYAQNLPFGIWELLCFVIIILTLPIIPLIYSSIITMLVMRFIPFAKNKDAFNMISGVFIIVLALGFSMYMNTLSPADEATLINMLMEGNNSLVAMFSTFFPYVANATHMIFDADILQFIIYIIWNFGFICIFLLLGKYVYFKGAIGINESASNNHKIDIRKKSNKTPILRAYAMKEFKLLYRTPVYFTNCILTVIIVPFMFIIMLIQPNIRDTLSQLPIDQLFSIPEFPYYVVLAITMFNCFCAPLSSIAQTAISREGDHVSFMKFIPVSYETQLYAKALVSIVINLVSILPVWFVVVAYFKFHIALTILSLLSIIFSNIAINLIGIIIDTTRPKLVWEQETAAVKQNMNAILPMLVSVALCVLIGFGMFQLPSDAIFIFLFVILALLVIIIFACRYVIRNYAVKMFEKIS